MLIEKSMYGWELRRISNGKLSCDNYSLESSDDIEKVRSCIQQKFGNILKEEGIIVSWDNWSGTFIMQMPGMDTESSNLVIKEIYEFLTSDEFLYIKGGINMGGRKYLESDEDDLVM